MTADPADGPHRAAMAEADRGVQNASWFALEPNRDMTGDGVYLFATIEIVTTSFGLRSNSDVGSERPIG